MVCTAESFPRVLFYGGDGDGGLLNPVTFGDAGDWFRDFTGRAVPGDFNSDGLLDVAVGRNGGPISVFLGDTDGGFVLGGVYATSSPSVLNDFVVGDLNGDGVLDLAFDGQQNESSSILGVLLGNGDGTFGSVTTYPLPPASPGDLYLVDADSSGVDAMLLNTIVAIDAGVYGYSAPFQVDLRNGWDPRPLPLAIGPRIVVGDYNGDHAPDLASVRDDVGQSSKTIQIYLNGCP
jgi:hypothetical protein